LLKNSSIYIRINLTLMMFFKQLFFYCKDHRELYIGLLIGAIVGGAVGAGSARLFSGKVDDQLLNDMLSKVGVDKLSR
jgi:lipoprotein signal peptidase